MCLQVKCARKRGNNGGGCELDGRIRCDRIESTGKKRRRELSCDEKVPASKVK